MMNTQTQSTLNIGGMACSGCANTVQKALINIDGVMEAKVNLDDKAASVLYDTNTVSTDDFKKAIEDAGYTFKNMSK